MYLGRIVEAGTVEEVLREPKHPYTRALFPRCQHHGRPPRGGSVAPSGRNTVTRQAADRLSFPPALCAGDGCLPADISGRNPAVGNAGRALPPLPLTGRAAILPAAPQWRCRFSGCRDGCSRAVRDLHVVRAAYR